jgi:hypothetical protein
MARNVVGVMLYFLLFIVIFSNRSMQHLRSGSDKKGLAATCGPFVSRMFKNG